MAVRIATVENEHTGPFTNRRRTPNASKPRVKYLWQGRSQHLQAVLIENAVIQADGTLCAHCFDEGRRVMTGNEKESPALPEFHRESGSGSSTRERRHALCVSSHSDNPFVSSYPVEPEFSNL